MRHRVVAVLGAFALLSIAPGAYASDHQKTVYRFQDPRIIESSNLLDEGNLDVTTNDSGDGAYVYVVNAKTGATVGRTTYATYVQDVEAIAPAGPNEIWAGDIGDNIAERATVQVYRVPFAAMEVTVAATPYQLKYPDGPHDAESLIAAPSGRLYIITKGITGGNAYVAPLHLDAHHANVLKRVGPVDEWATDAALFPGGHFVIVRGYATATVYRFPSFRSVGTFRLPAQRQGEGISIGPGGRIRLSSEGKHSPVLQIRLPKALARQVGGLPKATTGRPASGSDAADPGSVQRSDDGGNGWVRWAFPGALVIGAAGIVYSRRRNRPSS